MALTCCDLKSAFDACRDYSINGGTCVPKDCCFEALNIRNTVMSNHKDTVDACHCILDAAGKLPNINATAFANIPQGCGIRLPFNFHIGMDCDSDRAATDNKTLFETTGQRKTGGLEPYLLDGKEFKKRRMLKTKRRTRVVHRSNTTQSSSSMMNGPSFLMVHTCLVAIVEALLIAFHNA
ncbi:hypothetical protein TSUD_160650 [Trifolium subterraneum]|uniref:Bifunctional inhibitor/plant lipid transfer protein/seed storage helical domain-containing protein n=1 Tax=Trifolium subterraneum TaxID=3900 RepID=A0A2Z6MS24_TRISU|nr:hypothetical protein TSUD_160650 [Trifolium subterraneum]